MSRVRGAIGFGVGFAPHWLKKSREIFEPITKRLVGLPRRANFFSYFDYSILKAKLICCFFFILNNSFL